MSSSTPAEYMRKALIRYKTYMFLYPCSFIFDVQLFVILPVTLAQSPRELIKLHTLKSNGMKSARIIQVRESTEDHTMNIEMLHALKKRK